MKTPVIVDIETDGRAPQVGSLLAVGYAMAEEGPGGSSCVWSPRLGLEEQASIREYLADPERPVVTMTKYDARYLRLQGWDVTGPYYDLQVMAWVLNENQTLSLDALTKRYLGLTMDKRLKRRSGELMFAMDDGTLVPMAALTPEAEDQMVQYCGRDVDAERDLFRVLWASLESTAWLDYFLEEEVPFTSVLLDMECSGLPVNLSDSEKLRERLQKQHELDHARLLETGGLPEGFNVNSGDQLAAYLYHPVFELADRIEHEPGAWNGMSPEDKLEAAQAAAPEGFTVLKAGRVYDQGVWTLPGRQLPPTTKTDSGSRWSTASPVLKANLKAMSDPWVQELVEYRKVEKVLTTYLRRFPELAQTSWEGPEHDGAPVARLYGRFNQTGTKTGRLSSSEPNLQNIPARGDLGEAVRSLFQGNLVVGDYSQLEPRLLAHYSQDPVLLDIYRSGKDIYNVTGSAIFGLQVEKGMPERDISKVVFLGDQYGMGDVKLAATLTMNGFPTQPDRAKDYQNELHALYAIAEGWKDGVRARVRQRGYVTTIGGRHRRLKAAFADRRNWKNIGYGERQAVNAIIQGSAGDIVRRVMGAFSTGFPRLALLAQVHDELVWQVADFLFGNDTLLRELERVGETAHGFDLTVPLVFEPHFGTSWFGAKEGIELPDDIWSEESVGYEEE
jgi:DNA polymerase I-like protein with 3'-5' exonuclease and polymerase domains